MDAFTRALGRGRGGGRGQMFGGQFGGRGSQGGLMPMFDGFGGFGSDEEDEDDEDDDDDEDEESEESQGDLTTGTTQEAVTVSSSSGGDVDEGPVETGLGTSGEGSASVSTYTPPTDMPVGYEEYKDEAIKAAELAGVPVEWATDPAFIDLVNKESSWDPNANNPNSSAHGLGQFLDTTRQNYGLEDYGDTGTTDPTEQLVGTYKYIRDRYETPQNALNRWLERQAAGEAWY